jgi:hypothetical protein
MFLLDLACKPIWETYGGEVYLVGTANERGEYRDVDVRLILADKRYDRLRKAIGLDGIALMGLTTGQYLASLTGMPIDFQVQRRTEANEKHGRPKTRNPIGLRSMLSFRGDATPSE